MEPKEFMTLKYWKREQKHAELTLQQLKIIFNALDMEPSLTEEEELVWSVLSCSSVLLKISEMDHYFHVILKELPLDLYVYLNLKYKFIMLHKWICF